MNVRSCKIPLIFIALTTVGACSKIEYDYKKLGFSSQAEMLKAFDAGYHTKQKYDEIMGGEQGKASLANTTEINQIPFQNQLTTQKEIMLNQPVEEAKAAFVQSEPNSDTSSHETVKPSFDCRQATKKIEEMICHDDELANLDVKLNEAYKSAVKSKELKKAQINWMKNTRNNCQTKECLKSAMEQRILSFSN